MSTSTDIEVAELRRKLKATQETLISKLERLVELQEALREAENEKDRLRTRLNELTRVHDAMYKEWQYMTDEYARMTEPQSLPDNR